jgi:Spy/CpxP family protein refolding chaperone
MKRIILPAALALALSGGLALAQDAQPSAPATQAPAGRPHHAPNPEHEAKHLAKALNLTPEQTAKLEPIFANRDQQIEAIQANGQLTQQDARQQMMAVHKSTEEQLGTVLTPEQLQQWKQMRREHGFHGGPDHPQPQPQNPPAA